MNKRIFVGLAALILITGLAFTGCSLFKNKDFDGEVKIAVWEYGDYATAPLQASYTGTDVSSVTFVWRANNSSTDLGTGEVFYPREAGVYKAWAKATKYAEKGSDPVVIGEKPAGIEFFGTWRAPAFSYGPDSVSQTIVIKIDSLVVTSTINGVAQSPVTFPIGEGNWQEWLNASPDLAYGVSAFPKGYTVTLGPGSAETTGFLAGAQGVNLYINPDWTKFVRNNPSAVNQNQFMTAFYERQETLKPAQP